MLRSYLEELVKMVIAHHLDKRPEQVHLTQSLRLDLGFDNLSLIGIALELEDVQQAEFPIERLESAQTVADLVALASEVVPSPLRSHAAGVTTIDKRYSLVN